MSQSLSRVLVAVVAIPIFIALVWVGGFSFYLLVQAIMLLGAGEAFDLLGAKSSSPQRWTGYAFSLAWGLTVFFFGWTFAVPVLLTFLIVLMIAEMFRSAGSQILNISGTAFAALYASLSLGCMITLRNQPDPGGAQLVFLVFAAIWACDSLAYYGGRLFGKHKLFERVSPKKTWEGAVAGLLGAFLGVFVVRYLYIQFGYTFILSSAQTSMIGLFAGTLGQAGDLAESLLKRDAGIKDSSHLIPGHGGVLDRFDSLMFVAPATALYLQFTLH